MSSECDDINMKSEARISELTFDEQRISYFVCAYVFSWHMGPSLSQTQSKEFGCEGIINNSDALAL